MGLSETEKTTEMVLERMETSLSSMEQMSFDSINITDRLVTLVSESREYAGIMKTGPDADRDEAFEAICQKLDQILETAFTVNNVSHELEKEIVYQRDTADNIKGIVEFLYAMSE